MVTTEHQVALTMCAKITKELLIPVLHAEANAITKLARSNNNSDGSTLYVTASPCIECAKLIIQAGIKRVVYAEKYRLEDGIDLLRKAGTEVIYMEQKKDYGTEEK